MNTSHANCTLPDHLQEELEIVSIGLNPSWYLVEQGFYFARPANRFWKALNASGLIPEALVLSPQAVERLFRTYRIGFTDVVKRPSAGASELRIKDFKIWAPVLRGKLLRYRPGIAWFHGRLAYTHYLRYAEGVESPKSWGKQPISIRTTNVFVTPNPSPANAAFSLSDLIGWYRALKDLRDGMR